MNTDPAAAYDLIAPFYDLDFEDYDDDAAFYARLAAYHGARVLELGCGTGRVTVPLALEGLEVVGVDVSEQMLVEARMALADVEAVAGVLEGSATFILDDLRTMDLDRQFDLVCVPLGGFQHLESLDDLVAGMQSLARHLAPGGVAVVDVEAPHRDDWDAVPQPLVEHWTKPWGEGQVTKLVTLEPRPTEGLRDATWHYDVTDHDGLLRRRTAMFTLRVLTVGELDLAGRVAGLRVAGVFGGYDFSPYVDGSPRLIVLYQAAGDDIEYTYLSADDEYGSVDDELDDIDGMDDQLGGAIDDAIDEEPAEGRR